jgi:hypothetical protein
MAMKCPSCGIINPRDAERCDCGYDFVSQAQRQSYLEEGGQRAQAAGAHSAQKRRLVSRGIRLVAGGFGAAALGTVLCVEAKEFGLAWYHPIPAFLLALFLFGWGLRALLQAGQ